MIAFENGKVIEVDADHIVISHSKKIRLDSRFFFQGAVSLASKSRESKKRLGGLIEISPDFTKTIYWLHNFTAPMNIPALLKSQ